MSILVITPSAVGHVSEAQYSQNPRAMMAAITARPSPISHGVLRNEPKFISGNIRRATACVRNFLIGCWPRYQPLVRTASQVSNCRLESAWFAYGARRHVAQRVCDVIEFAVEGIPCARVKTYPIAVLDGNRSIAINFYFPDPIGGLRHLCYGQAIHRLNERGGFLWKDCQFEFWRHARAGISREQDKVESLIGICPVCVYRDLTISSSGSGAHPNSCCRMPRDASIQVDSGC
jgi:hypothetical protein